MHPVLFGTDGVRGPAGEGLLAPQALVRLGLAVAADLRRRAGKRKVPRALLGRDTRVSGPAVASAVSAGLLAGGVEVVDAGVLPTPAVALLTRAGRLDLGVVVSASHNPWPDNGVKLLGGDGGKLPDARERAVAAAYFADPAPAPLAAERIVSSTRFDDAADVYAEAVRHEFRSVSLRGLRIVVDAANGAQSAIAAPLLRQLGAAVTSIADAPDGRNINEDCGALHTRRLSRTVRARRAHLGIAFDGDADRVQLCDEAGRLLDGDALLAALAPRLRAQGRLPQDTVVGTSMTNGALEALLRDREIHLVRTDVGDRHIVAAMRKHGWGLGGEPSGHLILPRDGLLSGDGLRAALAFLTVMRKERVRASEAVHGYSPWPLEIVSLRVRARTPIRDLPKTSAAIAAAEGAALNSGGRVVVRYSGTEPKLRVMVEAPTKRALRAALAPIVSAAEEEVGER